MTMRAPKPCRSRFENATSALGVFLLHVPPLTILITGSTWQDWVAGALLYSIGAFSVAVGLHRYFAHGGFKTSRMFQFMMAIGAASALGDAIGFAGKHRLHHRFSDTAKDVHSPLQGFWFCWFRSLWDEGYTEAEILRMAPDVARFPELRLLHRFFYVPAFLLGLATFLWGGWSMFAVGFCLSRVAIIHLTSAVNYFGHGLGRPRYDTGDASTNSVLLALATWGEGWHNNHHHYPPTARAGFFWWEFDLFYYLLRMLALLGVVWDLREVPARVRDAHIEGGPGKLSPV